METLSTYQPPDLKGRVALVAGATRGVGRGTALALGEAGATVYCTGRSTRAKHTEKSPVRRLPSDPDLWIRFDLVLSATGMFVPLPSPS